MITADGLRFGYDREPVVADVSLALEPGETHALMGANGSGKTTLLKLFAGLYEPDGGTIDRPDVVGFAPEDPRSGLFAETVAEEVAFFPTNRGLDVASRTDDALTAMDIVDIRDRDPYSLSAGEQRRVSIASVIAGDPAVLTLDEPTAGLDATGERQLAELLSDLQATILFSTHAADFAYRVADRVTFLRDGEVLATDDTHRLLADADRCQAAGVYLPGPVRWAREHGIDPPPTTVEEAVAMVRRDG